MYCIIQTDGWTESAQFQKKEGKKKTRTVGGRGGGGNLTTELELGRPNPLPHWAIVFVGIFI